MVGVLPHPTLLYSRHLVDGVNENLKIIYDLLHNYLIKKYYLWRYLNLSLKLPWLFQRYDTH